MSRLALVPLAFFASGLLLGCDGQLFAPTRAARGSASFAQGGSSTPAEPTATSATVRSETQIDVAWRDNSTNETVFEVQRSVTGPTGTFAVVATTGANVVALSDAGLSASTQYCYRVRAGRTTGNKTAYSAFSNGACATTAATTPPPPPPPTAIVAPSQLSVTRSGSSTAVLSWTSNDANATGEHGYRSLDDGASWVLIYTAQGILPTTPPPYTRGATDVAAPSDKRVCYRVTDFNSTTESAPSNVACVEALPPPPPPPLPAPASDVTAIPANSNAVTVTWNGNVAAPTTYRAYRSIDDGATWTLFHTNQWDYTGYPIPYTLSAGDDKAIGDQRVCYRVIASSTAGDAAPSAMACTVPLATPTNLVITRLDSATVDLQWTDASSVEDGYEIWGTVSTPYWCDGACNGDVGFGEFLIVTLPANSTVYHCDNCTVPYGDPADRNYLIRLSVVAIKSGYKSYLNSGSVP